MLARLMGLKTISPVDLLPLIEAKAVSVFDVNSSQSWREAHVPGALPLDPGSLLREKDLPDDRNSPNRLFAAPSFICRKRRLSARAPSRTGWGIATYQ